MINYILMCSNIMKIRIFLLWHLQLTATATYLPLQTPKLSAEGSWIQKRKKIKTQKVIQKSCTRETLTISTDADSRTVSIKSNILWQYKALFSPLFGFLTLLSTFWKKKEKMAYMCQMSWVIWHKSVRVGGILTLCHNF